MPLYRFESADGAIIEEFFPMSERPGHIRRDGKRYDRQMHPRAGSFHKPANYPLVGWAAGVHPSQVAAAMESDRRNGVPTEYTKDGDPIWTSRLHRRKHCESIGLFDKNGGYGDPQLVGAKERGLPEIPWAKHNKPKAPRRAKFPKGFKR